MPLNHENPLTHSRLAFCRALKAARERKGITLAHISNTTKIPASLFEALERNDLHAWPKGLYRRAYFRDYARLIGVPLAESCAEFVRLFAEEDSVELTSPAEPPKVEVATGDFRAAVESLWTRVTLIASRLFARAGDAPQPSADDRKREWVSDARRVDPDQPPKFRVRIKIPH